MKQPCHTLPMGYACMLCKCSNSILSNYKDDDIGPELAKLDEMMSSIAREMEDDSSLAATVVTAFLKKEHTLAQENSSDTVYITQVENPSLYFTFYSFIRKCSRTSANCILLIIKR